MGFANPQGRNWSSVVNWDGLGKLYASLIVLWTAILLAGVGWLVYHRNLYFLRIRNMTLAIASVSVLHVYLVKIFLAYTTNDHFPCGLEFWVMGIYLPFGIALFQLNMVQLQSISGQQRRLISGWSSPYDTDDTPSPPPVTFDPHPSVRPLAPVRSRPEDKWGPRKLLARFNAMTAAQRTQILIAIAMVAQFVVILAVYLASRKFHNSWGSTGPSKGVKPAECRQGWEWTFTALWQLIFAWFYGPYVLYKIRNINDVHYWRIQTTLCVVSALPGSPLWVASVYSTGFKWVNRFWVPPMWIAPGIMVMQGCTIFFPIFEAYTSRSQLRSSVESMGTPSEKWGSRDSTVYTASTDQELSVSSPQEVSPTATMTSNKRRGIYSMTALDKALEVNATPLLYFAATKDFTGENIIFLMWVRHFRTWWARARREHGLISYQSRYRLFRAATEIFITSVHTKTADFPINVEGRIRLKLEAVFRGALWTLEAEGRVRQSNPVDPFDQQSELDWLASVKAPAFPAQKLGYQRPALSRDSSQDTKVENSMQEHILGMATNGPDLEPVDPEAAVPIPAEFNEHIFDEAEQEVKYMVVTNTWPRFIDSNRLHKDLQLDHEGGFMQNGQRHGRAS